MNKFNEKSKAAYDKIADDYDNTPDGKFTRKFKTLLLSIITLKDNDHVLDVACGNGTLLAAMSKRKTIKGFGIDISERMIKNAAALNPGMEFQAAGCEAIPFQNNTMDIITVSAAYHHFPNVDAFAKEAKRLLKSSGKIYIADVYLPLFLRIICNPLVPLMPAGDVKFYSPDEIINHFTQRYGFEKINIKIIVNIQIISMKKL